MKKILTLIYFLAIVLIIQGQPPVLNLVQVASGFTSPVDIKNCGDGRIFIVEQAGRIRIMDKHGNINPVPFLDISSRVNSSGNEQGLLTLAFSPHYKQDSSFYINYIGGSGTGSTFISRFKVSADSNIANPNSERILITFSQPYVNHNGATLMFGPDGYLYDTQGDGGDGGDPDGNGQNKNVYLAKMLRIDVHNTDTTYTIPPSNPFVGLPNTKPEIWAYGLRNPWRCAVDAMTGDIWIGDVGQALYEEVDFQPAADTGGQNYGWRCYEADSTYNTSGCISSSYMTFPIFQYVHSTTNGCSIIGGYVYRGVQFSRLFGKYIFTDFCSGRCMSITRLASGTFHIDTLQNILINEFGTFGQDNEYEMYAAGRSNGIIYHLTDISTCKPVAFISFLDSMRACESISLTARSGDSLSYQWYHDGAVISGADSSSYHATVSGIYQVQVSKSDSGCSTMSDSLHVVIDQPDSLVSCQCPLSICDAPALSTLSTFILPAGGSYSGRGIINGSILNTSAAGTGPDTLSYTYINARGCIASTSVALEIGTSTQLIDTTTALSYCTSDSSFSLIDFVNPAGGLYSGHAVSGSTFYPAMGSGNESVYYTYTNQYGCISVDSLIFHQIICTEAGIRSISSAMDISIHPNPNNGVFAISISSGTTGAAQLSIVDGTGRICTTRDIAVNGSTTTPLELSYLSKGIYTIVINTSEGSAVRRFTID